MHKIKIFILFFLATGILLLHTSWQNQDSSKAPEDVCREWIVKQLTTACTALEKMPADGIDIKELKKHFHASRYYYKQVEFFVEYCSPREAKYFINGPLVPKYDEEYGNSMLPPQGFQRIEELLYDAKGTVDTSEIYRQVRHLSQRLKDLCSYYKLIQIQAGQVLEMTQLELYRMVSMNLNGYDESMAMNNVEESAWCMEGLEEVYQGFSEQVKNRRDASKTLKAIIFHIKKTKSFLLKNNNYNTFNRLEFITRFVNPLNKLFVKFHQESGLAWNKQKQPLLLNKDFLFGQESFNLRFFSIYYDDTLNLQQQADLGKMLFFESLLSGNNKRSCASCHIPSKAFTDGLAKSITIDGQSEVSRNAPTLLNVVFQRSFFYDGRVYQLEQQVEEVLRNPKEMNSSLQDAVKKLRKEKKYRDLFKQAFKGTGDSIITGYAIKKAIAEYEKTLLSFNSRFDQYIRGDEKKLNEREVNGYNLFAGKALCGSCHFFPFFNGTVPPFYSDSEFEVIGTSSDTSNKKLDDDPGRFKVTGIEEQKFAFKTPTVRNIELSAPYMHNGAFRTLEQVVEFYHRGGGVGFNYKLPNQTLPFDSLQLNTAEKENIVLFLKSLTDTTGIPSKAANTGGF